MSKRITSLLVLIIFVCGLFSSVSAIEKFGTMGAPTELLLVAAPEDESGDESTGDPAPEDDPSDEPEPDPEPEPEPQPQPTPAPDVSISFNNPPDTMTVGDKSQINVTMKNAPKNSNVKWDSSNNDVATVDSDGNVTAVSPGKVEISASVPDTDAKTSALIEVVALNAKSIKITSKELSAADLLLSQHPLAIGDVLHLDFELNPKEAEKTAVEWASDNEDALTVTADGVVTAVAEGNATVTLTMGDVSDTISFKVGKEKSQFGILLYISAGLLLIAIIIVIVLLVKRGKRKKAEREEEKRKIEQLSKQGMQRDNSINQNAANIEAMQNQGKYTDDSTKMFTPDMEEIDPLADAPIEGDDFGQPVKEVGIDDILDVDDETAYLKKEYTDDTIPLQKEEPFSLDDID